MRKKWLSRGTRNSQGYKVQVESKLALGTFQNREQVSRLPDSRERGRGKRRIQQETEGNGMGWRGSSGSCLWYWCNLVPFWL